MKTGVVDYLVLAPDGTLKLFLLDDLDWADESLHIPLLQEKLGACLDFVAGEQIWTEAAKVAGRVVPRSTPLVVRLVLRCDPPANGRKVLHEAFHLFENEGCAFTFEVMPAPH